MSIEKHEKDWIKQRLTEALCAVTSAFDHSNNCISQQLASVGNTMMHIQDELIDALTVVREWEKECASMMDSSPFQRDYKVFDDSLEDVTQKRDADDEQQEEE